ncbi:hypothetical protein OFO01_07875 [Campylobacter sp. JMF_01 NE2]|uniref:zinc finger-like domain-containing protein n=1 Tax=unclassified Campylobacter TaxID=2593542 RepID=UPI0022E9F9A5|nr:MULTISPECIES: hypothetical protein [unclassified Campylobacter]MDA3053392.1 hypothetical protein [Campylobacter sp. JMF_03 NE3]MDA3067702.1 hypothetical protein [Campylobacter sp. JMF_01 NE2]
MDEIYEALIQKLRNLIDKNSAKASDLRNARGDFFPSEVKISIKWDFDGEFSDEVVAGGENASIHFGKDRAGFEAHASECMSEAKNSQKLHEILLSSLREGANSAIASAQAQQRYYSFSPFSVYEGCEKCAQEGKIACKKCAGSGTQDCSACEGAGKQPCFVCAGAGQIPATYIKEQSDGSTKMVEGVQTCQKCGGAGYEECQKCAGAGKLKCKACDGAGWSDCEVCAGNGFFIRTRSVCANASASARIGLRQIAYNDEFLAYLCAQNLEFIASKIAFTQSGEELSESACEAEYIGKCKVVELRFEIFDKNYVLVGFGDPLSIFIKPKIFDDLFADDAINLVKIQSQGGMSARQAYGFFEKYSAQPVLDSAMKKIASAPNPSEDEAVNIVKRSCEGFIGDEMARNMSAMIRGCLDRVSPTHSRAVWGVLGAIVWVLGALGACGFMAGALGKSALVGILGALCVFALAASVCGAVLWGLSSVWTLIKQREIPSEYRRSLRNRPAFVKFAKILAVFVLAGSVYGALVAKNSVPKIAFAGKFENLASQLCAKFSPGDSAPAPVAIKDEGNFTVVIIRDANDSVNISQKEKIFFIQKAVGAKQDGIFGRKTRQSAQKFIEQNLTSVDEIYEAVKKKQDLE